MNRPNRLPLAPLALLLLPVLLGACYSRPEERPVAPALSQVQDAYELTALRRLPGRAPIELPGLANVYRLSENVISGGEPLTPAAFKQLTDWGVRTILTVDGKSPDVAAAREQGLRYVHVPILYSGIDGGQLLSLAKVFRELDGPFYVHCFHGQHRGPAAAALGRLVLDGAQREQVLAEMRQWCGTSGEYEGLYRSLACAHVPDAAASAALDYDFPERETARGLRGAMVGIARVHDRLESLAERGFAVDPARPDIDPLHEALVLVQMFEQNAQLAQVQAGDQTLRDRNAAALSASRQLVSSLRVGTADEAVGSAQRALDEVTRSCAACHQTYRDR